MKEIILKIEIAMFIIFSVFFLSSTGWADLLFNGDFEEGSLPSSKWSIAERGSGAAVRTVSSPVRNGTYAVKYELYREGTDPTYRAEIVEQGVANYTIGEEYWFGMSMYIPDEFAIDTSREVVYQWHGRADGDIYDPPEQSRNPIMAIRIDEYDWVVTMKWDPKPNTYESGNRVYGGSKNWNLGPFQKGKWTDWVINVKFSYLSDGIFKVWKDGELVIDRKGPNCYNDVRPPYTQMGLYKSDWKYDYRPPTDTNYRAIYHDEFRIGDANSSYDEVAPGGGGSLSQTYKCSDGTDNDGDGLTDYPTDPGCSSTTDNDEYNAPSPPTNSLANNTTMITNSQNFTPTHPVENLWDGITDSDSAGTAGAGAISSYWIEFDFGQSYDLTSAQLFGDAVGNWVSKTWQLQYKQNENELWQTDFSSVNVLFNDWSIQNLHITARYIRVEVFGDPAIPATQARELKIYGTPHNVDSPADTITPSAPTTLTISQ